MHDALALVGHAEVLDAEVLDVPLERLHLGPRRDVGQEGLDGLAARVEGRGDGPEALPRLRQRRPVPALLVAEEGADQLRAHTEVDARSDG